MRKLGILARDSCSLDLERVLRRLRFLAAARDPLDEGKMGLGDGHLHPQHPGFAQRITVVAHDRLGEEIPRSLPPHACFFYSKPAFVVSFK